MRLSVILQLAWARLLRKKSTSFTLAFLSLLTVLFLNTGLILNEEAGQFYEKKTAELKSPDFWVLIENTRYKQAYEDFIVNDARTALYEKEDAAFLMNTKTNVHSLQGASVFFNYDTPRKISPITLTEETSDVPAAEAVYVPQFLKGNGAKLGGEFVLSYKNRQYVLRIAGFFETTYMGNANAGMLKYYVHDEVFKRLYAETGSAKMLSAKLETSPAERSGISESYKKDFIAQTDYNADLTNFYDIEECSSARDMRDTIDIIMQIPVILFLAFSAIITVIIIVITQSKVREEIDETLPSIGSLLSAGFTSGQIMLSFTVQFLMSSAAGGAAGLLCGRILTPALSSYSAAAVGMLQVPGTHPAAGFASIGIVLLFVIAGAVSGTLRLRNMTPVTALRGGVETHHFAGSLLPLSQGRRFSLLRIALKNMMHQKKQSFTIMLVIALGVFALGITCSLYGMFTYNSSFIAGMTGMEVADLQIQTLEKADIGSLRWELEQMPQVVKTNLEENCLLQVEGMDVMMVVSDNFDNMEVLKPSSGEYPVHENEIVLSANVLAALDKSIGDTVSATLRGVTMPYYITGSSSSTNMGGRMGIIHLNGVKRLFPYYRITQIDVYLDDGVPIEPFTENLYGLYGGMEPVASEDGPYAGAEQAAQSEIIRLMKEYGISEMNYAVSRNGEIILSGDSAKYRIKDIINMSEYLDGQISSLASVMTGFVLAIFLTTMAIIGAVISISVKTLLQKRRKELGVYKAMGYTTGDLIKMISLQFTVLGMIGASAGAILCGVSAGPLLQLFFSSIGLTIENFPVTPDALFLTALTVVFYVWAEAAHKSYQIRKITVYTLMTE